MSKQIITRFAPSPTGYLHIGGVRTALFSYLFAKKNNGLFYLRIEDTDTKRNKKEYEEDIIKGFKDVGIDWDNSPIYRQSEHLDLYRQLIEELIRDNKAYISKEIPKEEGDRDEVIRFRNPNKDVIFNDIIHGEIKVNTKDLGDFVIAKSLNEPVFHFANVVDDHAMGITHIIRGEEHLPNTPRQILIHEALGFETPSYAHIPLVLAKDRSKLSKRYGDVALRDFLGKGYLPEALVNYLALLGWHPTDEKEIFSLPELTQVFNLERVQKAGAIWDMDKLDWMNEQYLKKMDDSEFAKKINHLIPPALVNNHAIHHKVLELIKEKISTLSQVKELFENGGELAFVSTQDLEYDADLLLWKKNPDKTKTLEYLNKVSEMLGTITENEYTTHNIKNILWQYAEEKGRGEVLWPMRVALTGQDKSPDPFTSAYILGQDESIKRIKNACEKLST